MNRRPRGSTLFPSTPLFRSDCVGRSRRYDCCPGEWTPRPRAAIVDRKSTRLNSSHLVISYAVFCLQKQSRSLHILLCAKRIHSPVGWACWPPLREFSPCSPSSLLFFLMIRRPPRSTPFPYTTLFR